jgi:drug/metabolite transporter superfamily protein YnfA
MLRIAALVALAAFMVIVMIATWGSIGSAAMAMGLITMGAALLYRRFLNREDPDQWDNY